MHVSDASAARLARALFLLECVLLVVGISLSFVVPPPPGNTDLGDYLLIFALFAFPTVGFMITTNRPRNTVGWILLAIGFVWTLGGTSYNGVTSAYERYALIENPGSLPGARYLLAFDAATWVPAVGLIGTFLLLLFPDGRLPSSRWRPVAWLSAAALFLAYVLLTVWPGTFKDAGFPGVHNPLGIEALRGLDGVLLFVVMLTPISIVLCAAGLVSRFRRSRGVERLQLKWFTAAASVCAVLYLLMMVLGLVFSPMAGADPPWPVLLIQDVAIYSFVLIPIAAGVAITRYRLYDIDRVVNRTLVYALLTSFLTAAYLLLAAVSQRVLSPVTGDSDLSIAVSTLVVAALFRPARARVQGFIDRRFYRRKYDVQRTLENFASRLREEVDLPSLSRELLDVVHQTMQPQQVSLWLRPR